MKRTRFSLIVSLGLAVALACGAVLPAAAASVATEQYVRIAASGRYGNWDGVSNVAQFKGADGSLCYAVDSDTAVTVYKTKNGAPVSGSVTLKKPHPLFGTVVCDGDGNYYLVTGETNETNDTNVETVFISKFDQTGKLIKTTGDNGSSSLAYYYDSSFYTQVPFSGGTCDAAISGNILTVHYAREMYSGHQSNSVFSVNTADMSKVSVGTFYESHSFAQRVVPTKDGFVYISEGDCYDRAFCAYSVRLSGSSLTYSQEENIFDFWVEDGAFDSYNMFVVNNNFAHMGGLAALSDGKVAFVAQSAQSLNTNAASESEEIFIQIFDPYLPLNQASSYVTQGRRTGLAGNNGRTNVTNYGVKWLTSYGNDAAIGNVQIAATDDNEIVVLYELSRDYHYEGVWYMVLDEKGNVIRPATLFAANARLNPCETPVYADGAVCWVGNRYDDTGRIYIYRLSGEEEDCSVTNDHTWDNGEVTREATCAAEGEKTFTCTVCGATKTEKLPKTDDHSWDAGTVTREATCVASGEMTYTCTVCGVTRTETLPQTEEHSWDAGTVTKEATCVAVGEMTYTCTVCGATRTETLPQTDEHSWDAGTVTKEATCASVGEMTYTCTVCGATKTVSIPTTPSPGTEERIPGDVDGDGIVTPADARLALRASVKLENYPEGSPAAIAADYDQDGAITSADARLILRKSVGLT